VGVRPTTPQPLPGQQSSTDPLGGTVHRAPGTGGIPTIRRRGTGAAIFLAIASANPHMTLATVTLSRP